MRSNILLIIMGMAAVTYFTRIGSLVIFRYTGIPNWLEEWLRHVPTAVLTALIIPALILPKGQIDLTWSNHYLVAGIISAVIAYKSRNIIMTIGMGMATILCLNWLGI